MPQMYFQNVINWWWTASSETSCYLNNHLFLLLHYWLTLESMKKAIRWNIFAFGLSWMRTSVVHCIYLQNRLTKQPRMEQKKIACIYDLRLIFTVDYFVASDNSYPDSLYSGFPIHINIWSKSSHPKVQTGRRAQEHTTSSPAWCCCQIMQPANICSERESERERERKRETGGGAHLNMCFVLVLPKKGLSFQACRLFPVMFCLAI